MTTTIRKVWDESSLLNTTAAVGAILFLLQLVAYQACALPEKTVMNQQDDLPGVSRKCNRQQATTHPALLVPFLLAASDSGLHAMAEKPLALEKPEHKKTTSLTNPFK